MAPSTNDSSEAASSSSARGGDAGSRVPRTDQELAQAFRDLTRGEQTAAALEANLTNLESKLDELLASFESIPGDLPLAAKDGGGQDDKNKDKGTDREDQNGDEATGR